MKRAKKNNAVVGGSQAMEKRTESLLLKAKRHFARDGFEQAKLIDIAKDAGVAVGTIYLRYKSKAELLAAVFESVETGFCDAISTEEIRTVPFPDRFDAIMNAIFHHAAKESDLPALMAMSSFAKSENRPSGTRLKKVIANHIADGIAKGELRSELDTQIVAALAHGMVEGAMADLMQNPKADPRAYISELTTASKRWLQA